MGKQGENYIEGVKELMHKAAIEQLDDKAYGEICRKAGVSKMYYDINLGGDGRYRNQRTGRLVIADEERDGKIILYDNGEETGLKLTFPYYYEGVEYVHAYIEFPKGVKEEDLDMDVYQFMADVVYTLVSRKNMRLMLDFAEITDPLTGIPNSIFVGKKYKELVKTIPPHELSILFINIKNFKYINETVGAKSGDEAIGIYARMLLGVINKENEYVGRVGGDNFIIVVPKARVDEVVQSLSGMKLTGIGNAPDQVFDVPAWIGVSEVPEGFNGPFAARMNDAGASCTIAKRRLKQDVVIYNDDLVKLLNQNKRILALFKPAVENGEFHPYFQAKVDMHSGRLVGFEALCRWIHEGKFIYPDQFIPVLDKEGLIHELDMAIFSETCRTIRKWKDMGLNPPRISSNFSRKNLFVPDIEEKIFGVIKDNGLEAGDVEIEITESVKEHEYDRLIDYVKKLKEFGLHISIDDFGTGYSSLALIHNIDADVVKIDKSFVDEIPGDGKSTILIESIINIAERLKMAVIAEGVETAEQGKALLEFGCPYAQGYFYSKPVDYETATGIISDPPFMPIVNG